jgi:DNA invertase Pin-like site-specific DNA recombinase
VFNQRIQHIISKFGHKLKRRWISQPRINKIRLIFILSLAAGTGGQNTLSQYSNESDLSANESEMIKENVTSNSKKYVIPYTRVSSDEQKKNGRSIDSQQKEISSIVERDPEMEYYTDFIEDKGESGTNFDRHGIQRVATLAQEPEVTHIIVDTIDRIGRNVSKTLMFIENMREKHDVKIFEKKNEFDILIPEDKMVLNHKVMIAEFSTQNRARSSKRSSADNFIHDKQWCSWYRYAPFGYKLENEESDNPKGKGWIEKADEMNEIIQDIFDEFINKKCYSDVCEIINKKYTDKINEYKKSRSKHRNDNEDQDDKYEPVDEPLDQSDIKPIVTNPVYKGEPMISVSEFWHYDSEPSVQDDNLEFINESKFTKAQKIVAKIADKNSTNNDHILEDDEYLDEFNPFVIETVSPQVKLVCPKCSSDLNCNGYIRSLDGKYGNREYICSNDSCDYCDRWPKSDEKDRLEILTKMEKFDMIS